MIQIKHILKKNLRNGQLYDVAKLIILWYNDFIKDEIVDMNSCEFSICHK